MKKKVKGTLILILIILTIITAYNIFKALTIEKQRISIKYSSNASIGENLESIISVIDENNNTKKSKITLQLLDNNGKKIKDVKGKYNLNEGEVANCSLMIPDNLKSGNYLLRVIARTGIITTKKDVSINISDLKSTDIIISLDKGIYKPGDTINYQALLMSKNDSIPKSSADARVEIFDGNDNKVYSEDSTSSEFGIVFGKFTLASEVNSGTYTISVTSNSKKVNKTFTVNPYVIPQFEVKILSDKDVYEVGETANIIFNATYFFEEPVKNANVLGTIGTEKITGLTDDFGNFVYSYKMDNKGEKDISVSITDTSNYLIEEEKTIYAEEYPFEVEAIFENGSIYKNVENNVYLFAKKIDNTPIKAHINFKMGNIVRQVITDENGIGKLTLTANDTYNLQDYIEFQIVATDDDGNTYNKTENINVFTNSIAISTDKVRYDEGEDIKINLNSITDSQNRTVYICKNGEIKKMFSVDTNQLIVNLDDLSGLIDIFVEGTSNNYYTYDDDIINYNSFRAPMSSSKSFIRKTIFIKPLKSLAIEVSTDKEEYAPGEDLTLSFKVKDNNNNNVDSNLLVSILDEAVLNLAKNDLSIDNIRFALRDIELSNDFSVADLYSDILDNKSENRLILALLKNNTQNPLVKENSAIDEYSQDYNIKIIWLSLGIILTISIYAYLSNSKIFKTIIQDILNIFVISATLFVLFGTEIYDYTYDFSYTKIIICMVLSTLIVYCLALYKIRNKIFELIKDLLVIPGIYGAFLYFINEMYYNENIVLVGIFAIPVIMTVLIMISRKKELNKFWNLIKELSIIITKAGISYYIAYLLNDMTFDEVISYFIILMIVYFLFEKIYKRKILKEKALQQPINVSELIVIISFVIISVLALSSLGSYSRRPILYDEPEVDYYGTYDMNGSATKKNIEPSISIGATDSTSSISNKFDDIIDNAFNSYSNNKNNEIQEQQIYKEEAIEEDIAKTDELKNEDNIISSEKVRNIFLESLAFIPNLITNNGEANTNIKVSDNITTWNIQVVGNTKNGNLGYATKSFKVFKQFFVDFSLPANSIVGDKANIPVTVYNYKNEPLEINLNVVQNEWSKIGNYSNKIIVDADATQLVYIPLEIIKSGNNVLRVEARANEVSDIVERSFAVTPNGYKKSKVISSATIDKTFSTDYFSTEDAIENTRKLKFKFYPSAISQAIEGMESIFRMPTGCFEQTSSSLYPNILALKYLQDNNLDNEEVRNKAISYISSGYQRILTFEVNGTKGGYSLYGDDPAEPVITAFGLMELKDASEVYNVDENVINNMKDYLYSVQKINGSFDIGSTYIGGASSESNLAMNSYIIWALSEADSDDQRINKSIEYLENKIDEANDNYTLALMANAFANVKSKKANLVINKLMENVIENGDNAYINSNIKDYYGTYGDYQATQTTALTSMVLSKTNLHASTNNSLTKYLISKKDAYGNWGNTQSTILALKAINMSSAKGKISSQIISVSVADKVKQLEIGKNPLDIYELEFDNISDENKISIEFKKGTLTFELIEEYYIPYENINREQDKKLINISEKINTNLKVNDILTQEITIENISGENITNGLISVTIPQGFTVNQEFLEQLKVLGQIEKYEYNYTTLNLYIRNFKNKDTKTIEVKYRANFPEEITGGSIRVFDYYNPNIEEIKKPEKIIVND